MPQIGFSLSENTVCPPEVAPDSGAFCYEPEETFPHAMGPAHCPPKKSPYTQQGKAAFLREEHAL